MFATATSGTTVLNIAVERAFATYYIMDYEVYPRIYISLVLIIATTILNVWVTVDFTFTTLVFESRSIPSQLCWALSDLIMAMNTVVVSGVGYRDIAPWRNEVKKYVKSVWMVFKRSSQNGMRSTEISSISIDKPKETEMYFNQLVATWQ
ncbi:unnamed protein product, partial [Mesorhabditis belari]|uniref:Uncharacterized protein n=1 Tax=Mesorhabditis belari TaxID=2138241 RepID=A0AAF3J7E5_9BILA